MKKTYISPCALVNEISAEDILAVSGTKVFNADADTELDALTRENDFPWEEQGFNF